MTEVRGLCLALTAILYTLARLQLWLHRPTQEARSDKTPVLAQHAEQGALPSTENILPRHGILAWNPSECSVGKEPRRRTVSLLRREVPKPTSTYSFTGSKRWKPCRAVFLPRTASPLSLTHFWENGEEAEIVLPRRRNTYLGGRSQ